MNQTLPTKKKVENVWQRREIRLGLTKNRLENYLGRALKKEKTKFQNTKET